MLLGGKLGQHHVWKVWMASQFDAAKPGGMMHIHTSAPSDCGGGVDYCQQAAMLSVEIRRVLQGTLGRLAGDLFSMFANNVM